uniref:LAGLIDADG endonuclease n=1 Tax=Fusarium ficicrescens TaxID=1688603 RepID=A0A6M4B1B4_9HYPO|nr:LAGLIDADG endonuclease [Fusarium ficicrescens]
MKTTVLVFSEKIAAQAKALSMIFIYSILPTIGNVHKNALKKMNKLLDKRDYVNLPTSFLAFLVGLIDGDGYIQITKTTKGFITMKLVISLHIEDISTLEYIHSTLKLGSVNVYKDLRSPSCKLVINRTELQEVLFPLLIHNNIFFLTETRINQFNLAMHILKNDIKMFDQIPSRDNIEDVFKLPESAKDYTLLYFFKNWIVGFTCSEGSFFIKSNNEGCFQLKQRIHTNLFEAFKLVFNTRRKIDTSFSLRSHNNFNQFGVSSKSDIQTVIYFFSFEGLHPLIGLKYIQYIKWLSNLQNSMRYSKLHYPKL